MAKLFIENLLRLRYDNRESWAKVGEAAGVSAQAAHKWSKGGNISDEQLNKLAAHYGLSPSQLKYGEDSLGVVETRRARLRRVIEERYKGVQANMVRDTGINAGELSGLMKTRFFGEKKARTLEKQLGLPDMWFDGVDASDSNLIDDFRWILEHGADNEKTILIATVNAIKAAHKPSQGP